MGQVFGVKLHQKSMLRTPLRRNEVHQPLYTSTQSSEMPENANDLYFQ